MSIQVKYFASLRERLGRAEDQVATDEALTVNEVWQRVNQDPAPPNTLCAINMEYARWSDTVKPNDEVAFFPPVTGG